MQRTAWIGVALLAIGSPASAQDADLDAMFQAARQARIAGKNREALPMLLRSLKAHESAMGPRALRVGHHHFQLAYCHEGLGQWGKSVEACARAQAIYRDHLEEDDDDRLWMHHLQGAMHRELFQHEQAVRELEKAIRFPRRNDTEEEAKRYVWATIRLMQSCQDLGQYAKAEEWGERALRHAEARLGRKHATLAWARVRAAWFTHGLGDAPRTKTLLDGAMEILDVKPCPDEAEFGNALEALSRVHEAEGDHDEAERLARRAVGVMDVRYGASSAGHSGVLVNAAHRLMTRGKFAEADAYVRRAWMNSTRVRGKGNFYTADAALLLAQACIGQGLYKEAETHLIAAREHFSKQSDFMQCKY